MFLDATGDYVSAQPQPSGKNHNPTLNVGFAKQPHRGFNTSRAYRHPSYSIKFVAVATNPFQKYIQGFCIKISDFLCDKFRSFYKKASIVSLNFCPL